MDSTSEKVPGHDSEGPKPRNLQKIAKWSRGLKVFSIYVITFYFLQTNFGLNSCICIILRAEFDFYGFEPDFIENTQTQLKKNIFPILKKKSTHGTISLLAKKSSWGAFKYIFKALYICFIHFCTFFNIFWIIFLIVDLGPHN